MLEPIFNGTRARNIELAFLLALAFFFPLYEAPKNILGVLFFTTWTFNRFQTGRWGGPWTRWDAIIAACIALAVVGTPFAGIKGGEWVGLRDVVRTLLFLWCLGRAGYSRAQWLVVFAMVVAGAVSATLIGAWQFTGSTREGLELHSIGHSNHTATYLCTVMGIALALLVGRWSEFGSTARLALTTVILFLGVAVVATGSRVAVLCLPLIAIVAVAPLLRRSWKPLLAVLGVLALTTTLLVAADPWVLRKHTRNVDNHNVLAYRDLLWERAATAWRAHPVFGIGMDNFSRVTTVRYQEWTAAQGRTWDAARDFAGAHAHSLYFDTLAERGVVGVVAMLLLFSAWAGSLLRGFAQAADGHARVAWISATLALVSTLFIGLVNSTFHNEQAAVAVLCLAAWLARKRPAS
ncbi:MAG: O-antigen ligase family protein [Betaproteobacteria bacterium]|nr:O-antigen ligase family protein [Betaproteobacteria bacterium]